MNKRMSDLEPIYELRFSQDKVLKVLNDLGVTHVLSACMIQFIEVVFHSVLCPLQLQLRNRYWHCSRSIYALIRVIGFQLSPSSDASEV